LNLLDRRLVLFSGKGGVGKTTLASAFALCCARRGQRTLLIELNVKDRLSPLFGSVEVGQQICEVEENLYAVNISPAAALEEYGMMILRMKLVYKAVFENRVVHTFLKAVPGLNELLMLGKTHFHAIETNDRGKLIWDKVVVDAQATGHGLFFLRIPSVITSIIRSGHMFHEAKKIEDYLRDPKMTALVIVTLPEEMPVNETLMMRDTVTRELHIPIGAVVANAVYPPVFTDDEMALVDQSEEARAAEDAQGFIRAARFRSSRVQLQRTYLKRLVDELTEPLLRIPYYFTERFDFQTISKIADDLDQQLSDRAAAP
jgi:anion-transporting  ArsA/GET3 family ATPase